ncbi:hypothetical protein Pyn_29345 [Prunus yedoensis var. nudiflora]|uniref:Uncharacterized protein n=1 Tax=Prunus yedoensis var. nudiflora TaxID=2094558 RepID=A0A314XNU1_PRUYE|nr:hypothetical protein Pyn_29345 [Prunus yedoensis var. nudiflora]
MASCSETVNALEVPPWEELLHLAHSRSTNDHNLDYISDYHDTHRDLSKSRKVWDFQQYYLALDNQNNEDGSLQRNPQ